MNEVVTAPAMQVMNTALVCLELTAIVCASAFIAYPEMLVNLLHSRRLSWTCISGQSGRTAGRQSFGYKH